MKLSVNNPFNICRPIAGILLVVGVATGRISLFLAVTLVLLEARVMIRWRDEV